MGNRVFAAHSLRERGLTLAEIGWRLGCSVQTVRRLLNPDVAERSRLKSRQAKRRRTGSCVDCGQVTHLAKHGGDPSRRCSPCARVAGRRIDHVRVVALRREGLSQAQIAACVGCRQASVSHILAANGMRVGKGSGPGRGPKLA